MGKAWQWLCVQRPRGRFTATYWTMALLLALPVGSLVTRHFVPTVVVLLVVTSVVTGYKSLKGDSMVVK